MKENLEHFMPVIAKDMAHCRAPSAGCLVNYALLDAFKHVHLLEVGGVLDTEGFRSWVVADEFVKEHVKAIDKKEVAIIGDGQKGELKSHNSVFKNALLRACSRHRRCDVARQSGVGKVSAVVR